MAKTQRRTKPQQGTRRLETIHDPTVPVMYANNASVEFSNFDVQLKFGQILETTPEVVRVGDVVRVYMSHEHFRAFVTAIVGSLGNLEAMKAQLAVQADAGKTK